MTEDMLGEKIYVKNCSNQLLADELFRQCHLPLLPLVLRYRLPASNQGPRFDCLHHLLKIWQECFWVCYIQKAPGNLLVFVYYI